MCFEAGTGSECTPARTLLVRYVYVWVYPLPDVNFDRAPIGVLCFEYRPGLYNSEPRGDSGTSTVPRVAALRLETAVCRLSRALVGSDIIIHVLGEVS